MVSPDKVASGHSPETEHHYSEQQPTHVGICCHSDKTGVRTKGGLETKVLNYFQTERVTDLCNTLHCMTSLSCSLKDNTLLANLILLK